MNITYIPQTRMSFKKNKTTQKKSHLSCPHPFSVLAKKKSENIDPTKAWGEQEQSSLESFENQRLLQQAFDVPLKEEKIVFFGSQKMGGEVTLKGKVRWWTKSGEKRELTILWHFFLLHTDVPLKKNVVHSWLIKMLAFFLKVANWSTIENWSRCDFWW